MIVKAEVHYADNNGPSGSHSNPYHSGVDLQISTSCQSEAVQAHPNDSSDNSIGHIFGKFNTNNYIGRPDSRISEESERSVLRCSDTPVFTSYESFNNSMTPLFGDLQENDDDGKIDSSVGRKSTSMSTIEDYDVNHNYIGKRPLKKLASDYDVDAIDVLATSTLYVVDDGKGTTVCCWDDANKYCTTPRKWAAGIAFLSLALGGLFTLLYWKLDNAVLLVIAI